MKKIIAFCLACFMTLNVGFVNSHVFAESGEANEDYLYDDESFAQQDDIISDGAIAYSDEASQIQNVKYLDENGDQKICPSATLLTNTDAELGSNGTETWYVADGTVETGSLNINGNVHLILANGCDLSTQEIVVKSGTETTAANELTIYSQSLNEGSMGKLTAQGSVEEIVNEYGDIYKIAHAGIEVTSGEPNAKLIINGGEITATGGLVLYVDDWNYYYLGAAGIGGGEDQECGTIIINNGYVKATGNALGSGIGDGNIGKSSELQGLDITINGGKIEATSNDVEFDPKENQYCTGAGIGSLNVEDDISKINKKITINGGDITAKAGSVVLSKGAKIVLSCVMGTGIGFSVGGTININGGKIKAIGGDIKGYEFIDEPGDTFQGGAGIGACFNGCSININDSKNTTEIEANGGALVSGISGGTNEFKISINGGKIKATGGDGAPGIGSNCLLLFMEDDIIHGKLIEINGGEIEANGGSLTNMSKEMKEFLKTDNFGGAGIGDAIFLPLFKEVGFSNESCKIIINGGFVKATGCKDDENANDIGLGQNFDKTDENFSTGENGNALIFATNGKISTISDATEIPENISGIIFLENSGKVYGSPVMTQDFEVPQNKTLIVPENSVLTLSNGAILINNGEILNYGTINGVVKVPVSFDTNDGSQIYEPILVNYKSTYGSLPTPTRSGYEFETWYTQSGESINSQSIVNDINKHTLYAKWKENGGGNSSNGSDGGFSWSTIDFGDDNNSLNNDSSQTETSPTDSSNSGQQITLHDIKLPDYLQTRAYVNGYPNGNFVSENSITRAEAAQMLYKLIYNGTKVDYEVLKNFSDVKQADWFSTAVAYLANKQIVEGSDGKFNPNDKITRAEFSKMIYSTLLSYNTNKDANLIYGTTEFKFGDIANNWMFEPIKQLATNGIIDGYGNGLFKPNQSLTRAEAVTIINKAFERSQTWSGSMNFNDVSESHWAYKYIMNAANGEN